MALYGLLIDYNYCSGCRSCEVACQKAHNYDPSRHGLQLSVIGPTPLPGGKWQFDNLPLHTIFCNHCAQRLAKGKDAACAHHCQDGCITLGEIPELVEKMTGDNMVLYTL